MRGWAEVRQESTMAAGRRRRAPYATIWGTEVETKLGLAWQIESSTTTVPSCRKPPMRQDLMDITFGLAMRETFTADGAIVLLLARC